MSNKEVVGQLKSTGSQMDIEWEIADFLSRTAQVDQYCDSPMFFFPDSSWYIRLFPNGLKDDSSEGYVGVYFARGDSGLPVSVTYSLFLKKTDGREDVVNGERDTFDKKDKGLGKAKAIKRSDLVERKSVFMPSGVLTVICSVKCAETRAVRDAARLSKDLENLLDSGDESDVTFKVQGEDFRLHRAIVAARTPVFNSMFTHDMQEKATGVVSVGDCDATPFRTFMHYLYTGSTDGLSPENMFSLFKMADKYQVDQLKAACLEFMRHKLSVDTFCETLDLALQHEQQDLVEGATDFLSENASVIIGREDWQNLMRNNMRQMSELLRQALIRKDEKLADAEQKLQEREHSSEKIFFEACIAFGSVPHRPTKNKMPIY